MTLQCPGCQSVIPETHVYPDRKMASCVQCANFFPYTADDLNFASSSNEVMQSIPARLNVSEQIDGSLLIKWRWFNPGHLFLLFFCIAWDSFLFFWYFGAPSESGSGMDLIFYIFPLGHVAVGIGITYMALTGLLNSSFLTVSEDFLKLEHKPIWSPGQRLIPSKDVKQLYCNEQISRGRNTTTVNYVLSAILNNQQAIKLATFQSLEEAKALEHLIEKKLGIMNTKVSGEIA